MEIPTLDSRVALSKLQGKLNHLSNKKKSDVNDSGEITSMLDDFIIQLFDLRKKESELSAVNIHVS